MERERVTATVRASARASKRQRMPQPSRMPPLASAGSKLAVKVLWKMQADDDSRVCGRISAGMCPSNLALTLAVPVMQLRSREEWLNYRVCARWFECVQQGSVKGPKRKVMEEKRGKTRNGERMLRAYPSEQEKHLSPEPEHRSQLLHAAAAYETSAQPTRRDRFMDSILYYSESILNFKPCCTTSSVHGKVASLVLQYTPCRPGYGWNALNELASMIIPSLTSFLSLSYNPFFFTNLPYLLPNPTSHQNKFADGIVV